MNLFILISSAGDYAISNVNKFAAEVGDSIFVVDAWIEEETLRGYRANDLFSLEKVITGTPQFTSLLRKSRSYLGIKCFSISEKALYFASLLNNIFNPSSNELEDGIFFRDKLIMKQRLLDARVPVPLFANASNHKIVFDFVSKFEQGALLKPRFGWGSMGISHLHSSCEPNVDGHLGDEYMVEEYIPGDQFHCDALFALGRLQYLFCSRYLSPSLGYIRGDACGSMMIRKGSSLYNELSEFFMQIIGVIPNASVMPLHLDIYRRASGELVAGEIACRPGGNRIRGMIKLANGVDTVASSLRAHLGLALRNFGDVDQSGIAAWGGVRMRKGHLGAMPDFDFPPDGVTQLKIHASAPVDLKLPRDAADNLVTFLIDGRIRDDLAVAHSDAISWIEDKIDQCFFS